MPVLTGGLLGADDWTQMEDDFTSMRLDNEIQIVIRRETENVADHSLPPQSVRVSGFASRGRSLSGSQAEETHGRITIMGKKDMDIYPSDRFTIDAGTFKGLYRVDFVYPNRRAATMSEAQLVE